MAPLEMLLNKLAKVRRTKANCYSALCPAHDDKRPSLSIRERDDGVLLLKCWHGCSAPEIVEALGLTMQDLYPDRPDEHHGKGDRRPFPAAEALRMVGFECLVVAAAAAAMAAGEPLSTVDRERLMVASERLRGAASGAGL